MLDPVTLLCGMVVMSVHPTAPNSRTAEAASIARNFVFMTSSVLQNCEGSASEPEADARREGPLARIQVVVDAVQPRLGIDAAVAGDREHVLHRPVDTRRLQ